MTSSSEKTGILVVNLGTPDAPTPKAVKAYLEEFLWDPYIVQIPRPFWWVILHGIILKTRPKKSAKLYQKIWTTEGSPLLILSQSLVDSFRTSLTRHDQDLSVVLGMRYGNPSLAQALTTLKDVGVQKLIVLPLYPQYSTTTTASTFAQIQKLLQKLSWQPQLDLINNYHQEPHYINAVTKSIKIHWQQQPRSQILLFSFHGLPQKYVTKGDPYYDQCMMTAKKIAQELNLKETEWRVVFQSRFGAQAWLKPYCSEVLINLPSNKINTVDIVCPGFPVDCLETLEEIAITNKELFLKAGGVSYHYINSLNASKSHVDALTQIVTKRPLALNQLAQESRSVTQEFKLFP